MKLPPICAEFALFWNEDVTNNIPPITAEIIDAVPRSAQILTFLDFDIVKESTRIMSDRTSSARPSSAWYSTNRPAFNKAWKSPFTETVTLVGNLANKLEKSPVQPCAVSNARTIITRILIFLLSLETFDALSIKLLLFSK